MRNLCLQKQPSLQPKADGSANGGRDNAMALPDRKSDAHVHLLPALSSRLEGLLDFLQQIPLPKRVGFFSLKKKASPESCGFTCSSLKTSAH